MTSESEREQALRRLLTEAVEPVQPAPGAQPRLLARARAQHGRRHRPLTAHWALPVMLGSVVAIFIVTIAFAMRGGQRSDSASSATAKAPAAAASSAAASGAGTQLPRADTPNSPGLDNRKEAMAPANSLGGQVSVPLSETRGLVDLDGDGAPDSITLDGAKLTATLSRDGVQTVSLPPPVGPGARLLGGTTLADPSGKLVTVVFVRLTQAGAASTDTVVSVVGGRLTVLRQGADPALLTIDPMHGYACNQSALGLTGSATPFVVDGSELIASPQGQTSTAVAGSTTGCF